MRIAVVTETYPPEINGVALTLAGFVEQLSSLGHEILLTRPRQPADPMRPVPSNVRESFVRGAALPRYPGLRFGLPCGAHLRKQWTAAPPDAAYIATEGPLGWSAVRAARALGIPSATGFHTRFDDFAAHYGLGLLTPMVFAWLRRFHNLAGATVVPTNELKTFLEGAGFRRVHRLSRGVDTGLFAPGRRNETLRASWGVPADALAVVHVGRIAAEKNLDLAVRSFHAVREVVPGSKLVWIGDGPALPGLRREHPEFVYCGMRRGEDLAGHFASGDLFLFPSVTETFGNVTLEAMASGVPVVAFDYGAAREHIRDATLGALAPFGDSAAFVAEARGLAGDTQRRETMRQVGRAAVEHLSPRAVAENLAALLGDLRLARVA